MYHHNATIHGDVWEGGKGSAVRKEKGYSNGYTVRMSVNLEEGSIKWEVVGKGAFTHKWDRLKDSSVNWVPCIVCCK